MESRPASLQNLAGDRNENRSREDEHHANTSRPPFVLSFVQKIYLGSSMYVRHRTNCLSISCARSIVTYQRANFRNIVNAHGVICPQRFRVGAMGATQRQLVELALLSGKSMKARQCSKIAELRWLLEQSGYPSLDKQASALGLGRSTTWAILQASHKASGVSRSIIKRMLQSPGLPPAARQWIEEYVSEKMSGAYGHSTKRLRIFWAQVALEEMRAFTRRRSPRMSAESGAQAPSVSPRSDDNRPHITAATHCKDKAGQVWLKSSAELAGQTTNAGESTTAKAAGNPNLSSVAAMLPDCPDQGASQTTGSAPATSAPTTSTAGAQSSDTSGTLSSTKTPGGLTPD